MCAICVQIMREKITIKDALQQYREAGRAGADRDEHMIKIIEADEQGDTKRVAELVKAGYKKERWI